MNPIIFALDQEKAIRIRRDSLSHSWSIAVGSRWIPLPWKETADAVSVMLWVKERTGGTVPVKVEP